ncbi:MAG TPA: hypothetical protein VF503_01385 [Sphingobium sp.]|uniref:hypothetical protein n=1 Tax=Sphingobium sp. TaxID=1912891 RepID=UPI002ED39641
MNFDHTKWFIDAASIGLIFGAAVDMLPAIATGLSIIWTCIRIYETRTVQRWLGRPGGGSADR